MQKKINILKDKTVYNTEIMLNPDDTNAYCMAIAAKTATLKITAIRADGICVMDVINASAGETINYILKKNMYCVPGALEVRITQCESDGSMLTTQYVYFSVVQSSSKSSPADNNDDNVINNIARINSEVQMLVGKMDFVIPATVYDMATSFDCETTIYDILEAHNSGKNICLSATFDNNNGDTVTNLIMPLVEFNDGDGWAKFEGVRNDSLITVTLAIDEWSIAYHDSIKSKQDKDFIIHATATENSDGTFSDFSADVTYEQIKQAYDEGKNIKIVTLVFVGDEQVGATESMLSSYINGNFEFTYSYSVDREFRAVFLPDGEQYLYDNEIEEEEEEEQIHEITSASFILSIGENLGFNQIYRSKSLSESLSELKIRNDCNFNFNDKFSCNVTFYSSSAGSTSIIIENMSDTLLKWKGDDVIDGVFEPQAGAYYDVLFDFNGFYLTAYVVRLD